MNIIIQKRLQQIILYGRLIYTHTIYYVYIISYTCILYYTNIDINKEECQYYNILHSYIYGDHIAQSFEVKESKDEWQLCEVLSNILH